MAKRLLRGESGESSGLRPGYLWRCAIGVTVVPVFGMVAAVAVSQSTGSKALKMVTLVGIFAAGVLWFGRWELRTRPGLRVPTNRGRVP